MSAVVPPNAISTGPEAPPDALLHLHPSDNVAIARGALRPGSVTRLTESEPPLTVRDFIPVGHKIAWQPIAPGEPVRRYGYIIGYATQPIAPGEHVHLHNLGMGELARDYAFGADCQPVNLIPEDQRQTFMGFRRADGRVGTRNMIAVIASVNCSAHTVRAIAAHFTPERIAAYPTVDGVIALSHPLGCAQRIGSADYAMLQRTLAGMARHPNIAGCVMVGLGCETNQIAALIADQGLSPERVVTLDIQEQGGTQKTIAAGIAAIENLLPLAASAQRTPQPVSELVIALQCGGSDSWSGITANPLVGRVADAIVRQGGTVVLSETTEIYGAEPLLTRRAITPEVGQALVAKVRWWEEYTAQRGLEINNNPSVGNKAGGLTTIYEKSLGAVAKGGSTPLVAVYDYAAPVTARGLTFMDTPGYDPVAVTGQVAGGSTLVLFTTGRGSAFGFKPAPSIKIATNAAIYQHMIDDMDLNAGRILEGEALDDVAADLLALTLRVASGEPSKSEAQGIGEAEFAPWQTNGPV